MSYTPAPGSTAGRALAFLQWQPAGAEISTSALADSAGVPAGGFVGAMEAALKAGLVFARKKGGHLRSPLFWSLVDHARHSSAGEASSPANGSQTPNGATASSPRVRAGRDTPQEGANRDATRFEGRGPQGPDATDREARGKVMALDGSESPTGRGSNATPALGAAPAFHSTGSDAGRLSAREYIAAIGADEPPPQLPGSALVGRTATLSMTGEVAVVAECGTVILFDAQRGRQLVTWLAGRA